MNQKKKIRSNI